MDIFQHFIIAAYLQINTIKESNVNPIIFVGVWGLFQKTSFHSSFEKFLVFMIRQ